MTLNRQKWLLRGLCLAVLIAGMPLHAQELKIGYVDVGRVLDPQAKAIMKNMEKEFGGRQKDLAGKQKDLRDSEEKLMRDAAIMSESERDKAERELYNRKRDLRREQDEFKEDLNIRKNEELGKLQKSALSAAADIAKEEGYDLVVSDGVMFASQRIDITEKLLKKLKIEAKAQ
jgi:outer membrane protein